MGRTWALWILGTILLTWTAYGHEGHHHVHPGPESTAPQSQAKESPVLKRIAENYKRDVEPIFNKACMDCHSTNTRYPWYYKVPGIKQLLDSDITEARHHLDFSKGFPFISHASPEEDLEAIAKTVNEGSMPPFAYRLFHPSSKLTSEEKTKVLTWTSEAGSALSGAKGN